MCDTLNVPADKMFAIPLLQQSDDALVYWLQNRCGAGRYKLHPYII
jgi:hypothetical protein